jgi:hypothetical protein
MVGEQFLAAPPEIVRDLVFSCGNGRDIGFRVRVNPLAIVDGVIVTRTEAGEEIVIRRAIGGRWPGAYLFTTLSPEPKSGGCTPLPTPLKR